MVSWEFLDNAHVPGSSEELRLYRRGSEYSIRVDGNELMNSCVHGSEDALAELACARIVEQSSPRILIGGLGMGFTVAAALAHLAADGRVVVAELVPAVIAWNHEYLADLAKRPFEDGRVTVLAMDVGQVIDQAPGGYDAILLDVDNGPEGLTRSENSRLYTHAGLRAALLALRPGGVLAVWSASADQAFSKRLRQVGFQVEEVKIKARGRHGGARHFIWLARR